MDLETTMAMIDDVNPTNFKLDSVSSADRARIESALNMIFSGLTLMHWLDGGKLSVAWRRALDTMRPIGFDIPGDAPVVIYLRHANFYHQRKWEHKIVASRNGDDYVRCPPDQVEQWRERGHAQVRDGMELIRQTVAAFVPAVRNAQKMRPEMAREHEHVHEREREYERTRGK